MAQERTIPGLRPVEKVGIVALIDPDSGEELARLPVLSGSLGADVIDMRTLHKQTGLFGYDPGYMATASCESGITYVDGDKGELLYRGIAIEELAEHSSFLETCYLLLYGDLPTEAQMKEFDKNVTYHTDRKSVV